MEWSRVGRARLPTLGQSGRAFNMCGDVATPNLYAVAQQNCLQAPDTKTTVMGRRSGSSSSNGDVERAGPCPLSTLPQERRWHIGEDVTSPPVPVGANMSQRWNWGNALHSGKAPSIAEPWPA